MDRITLQSQRSILQKDIASYSVASLSEGKLCISPLHDSFSFLPNYQHIEQNKKLKGGPKISSANGKAFLCPEKLLIILQLVQDLVCSQILQIHLKMKIWTIHPRFKLPWNSHPEISISQKSLKKWVISSIWWKPLKNRGVKQHIIAVTVHLPW